jgi:hypothetical protein
MSKHDDNLSERVSRQLDTQLLAGLPPDVNLGAAEVLHRVPGMVSKTDRDVIVRAATLQLAHEADLDADSPESTGRAVAAICRAFLRAEQAGRSRQRGAPGEGADV